jgi:hypothetical protein
MRYKLNEDVLNKAQEALRSANLSLPVVMGLKFLVENQADLRRGLDAEKAKQLDRIVIAVKSMVGMVKNNQ